jgi:hypothetical protein
MPGVHAGRKWCPADRNHGPHLEDHVRAPTRTFRATAALAAGALLLAGCGDSDDAVAADSPAEPDPGVAADPQGALEDALAAVADWSGIEATITFEGDLAALAAAEGEELPAGVAEAFDNASTTIAGTFEQPHGFLLDMDVDGTTFVGVRYQQDHNPRVTVDLPSLRAMLDEDTERDLDDALGMAGMFGLRDLVDAFETGGWVELILPDDTFDTPGEDSTTADEFAEALDEALGVLRGDGVSVTHAGTDAHGDRLEVLVDTAELQAAMAEIDPSAFAHAGDDQDVPDEFTVDVWIADGQLARVALDFAALDPDLASAGPFVVAVDLTEFAGPVDLPDAETVVDLEELFGGMFGGFDEVNPGMDPHAEFDPEEFDEDDFAEWEAEFDAEMEEWEANNG